MEKREKKWHHLLAPSTVEQPTSLLPSCFMQYLHCALQERAKVVQHRPYLLKHLSGSQGRDKSISLSSYWKEEMWAIDHLHKHSVYSKDCPPRSAEVSDAWSLHSNSIYWVWRQQRKRELTGMQCKPNPSRYSPQAKMYCLNATTGYQLDLAIHSYSYWRRRGHKSSVWKRKKNVRIRRYWKEFKKKCSTWEIFLQHLWKLLPPK